MIVFSELNFSTKDEKLNDITESIQKEVSNICHQSSIRNGIVTLFCPHTSCALTLNEAYDPSAKQDLEAFYQHIAPRNLSFIKHTTEGPDDSPSHMKSSLLNSSLQFLLKDGEIILGTWQGIYLAEFRDGRRNRTLHLQLMGE